MGWSILVPVVLLLSATAHAQTSSAVFVEGAAFGDRDASLGGRDGTAPPMTPGLSGTIGFRISRGFSMRLEVEVPAEHVQPTYVGGVSGQEREEVGRSDRTVTYDATFAWHSQPADRVDVALIGGFGAAVSQTDTTGFVDSLARDGSVVKHTDLRRHDSYTNGSISLGTDVAIQLTRHIAVVPELRVHIFSEYGSVVRPKIALRWTF